MTVIGDAIRGGEAARPGRTLPRVIVVEDEADIREPLAQYLARSHFQVTAVDSAEAARAALAAGVCDLLIVDIMLPGEDGLSLTREVRATTDIPVMLVTARTETVDRIVGLELGADDYICKPFDARELVARINQAFNKAIQNPEVVASLAGDDWLPAIWGGGDPFPSGKQRKKLQRKKPQMKSSCCGHLEITC